MRTSRVKLPSASDTAIYHCISKTVNGDWLFDPPAQTVLRKQMWEVAEFTGVEILTYTILSNHFHILVRIPQRLPISDAELLRRYQILHPRPTKYQTAHLDVIRSQLASNSPAAQPWRDRQTSLMGDVSAFMKLLKQRFTLWFNQNHQRFGPLWCDRFKSILVESRSAVVRTVAAYIDLNCVRAGLANDPAAYAFCGYADALTGHAPSRQGLQYITEASDWESARTAYRLMLFGANRPSHDTAPARTANASLRATARPSTGAVPLPTPPTSIPLATALRFRIRHLTTGTVLGSETFVAEHLRRQPTPTAPRVRVRPRPLPAIAAWDNLATLHGPRRASGAPP